jgi:gliding motility-associated lipoprotein GldH
MNKILILLGLVVTIASCSEDKKKVYEEIYSIPSDGWQASKPLKWDMPVTDISKSYDILLHVRNTGQYAYSNLWLFIETKSPKGNSLRDTLEIVLADDQGRWLGEGISNINHLLVPYKENILFPLIGIYQVTITQAMREEDLKNILDIGVCLQFHP